MAEPIAPPDETKYCTGCERRKPVSEFYAGSKASRARYMQPCKECVKSQRRVTRRTERGAAYLRGYRLNYQFGITEQEYLRMAEAQDYRCAICKGIQRRPCAPDGSSVSP